MWRAYVTRNVYVTRSVCDECTWPRQHASAQQKMFVTNRKRFVCDHPHCDFAALISRRSNIECCVLQWLDYCFFNEVYYFTHIAVIGSSHFAMDSLALRTVQWLDHRILCDEFYCFTQITAIGLSHVLQWIQLLYKYCSDWIIAFFAKDFITLHTFQWLDCRIFTMNSIALRILQWLDNRMFCNEFYCFTHIAVLGL